VTGHYRHAEKLASDAEHAGSWQLMETLAAVAQVHATLALAPVWLTYVDTINFTGTYPLNLAHVVSISRDKDSQQWRAVDVHRSYHVIASDDDAKVEALIGGQP
jgi:hypothetical protein